MHSTSITLKADFRDAKCEDPKALMHSRIQQPSERCAEP